MPGKEIGKVEKIAYEETQVEWRIPDFFSVVTDDQLPYFSSPHFSVADSMTFLKLETNTLLKFGVVGLLLGSESKLDVSVEHHFGLKTLDGSVQSLEMLDVLDNRYPEDVCGIILSKFRQRRNDLAPCDVVTFVCTLKHKITQYTQPATSDKAKSLKLIRLDRLSENFKDIFGDKETCDTTLKVKNEEYKAHRVVLMARSTVFAAMFKHDTSERQTGVVSIPDCEPESFQEFLEYLYSGKLEEITVRSAINLYDTSDKYDVQELKAFCLEYLMSCCTVENICEIVVFADKYDEMGLLKAVQDFFNKNVFHILLTSEWEQLLRKNYRLANKLLTEMSKKKLSGDA